jgi:hypothetical protein
MDDQARHFDSSLANDDSRNQLGGDSSQSELRLHKEALINAMQRFTKAFRLADLYKAGGLDSRQIQRHFGDPSVAAAVHANDWLVLRRDRSYVFEKRDAYIARMPQWYRDSVAFDNGASPTPEKWIGMGESETAYFLRDCVQAVAAHKAGSHKARAARSAAKEPAPLKYGVSKKDDPAAYMRAMRAAKRVTKEAV